MAFYSIPVFVSWLSNTCTTDVLACSFSWFMYSIFTASIGPKPRSACGVIQFCRGGGDFEIFRPAEATRWTDRGEIWRGGVDRRLIPPRQIISLPLYMGWAWGPKSENFVIFIKFRIQTPCIGIPLARLLGNFQHLHTGQRVKIWGVSLSRISIGTWV